MTTVPTPATARRAPWALLAYSALFMCGALAHLLWLLWRYVPLHASLFAGMDIELPRSTLVTIAASTWAIRLFPFASILALPCGALAVGLLVLVAVRHGVAKLASGLATLGLVVALGESVACAFVVHSVHEGYSVAASNPKFQESLRLFEEFRKERAEKHGEQ